MTALWAIGDVHGCAEMLTLLIKRTREINPDGYYVFLGDYVGRGPSTKEALDIVMNFVSLGLGTALIGNHDKMFIANYEAMKLGKTPSMSEKGWHILYGREIMKSFGGEIDEMYIQFLSGLHSSFAKDGFCFQHGDHLWQPDREQMLVVGHEYTPEVIFEVILHHRAHP